MPVSGGPTRTMHDWPSEFQWPHRWEQGSNRMELAILGRGVVGLRLCGRVSNAATPIILPVLEDLLERRGVVHSFWDAGELDSHEAEGRRAFIDLYRNSRSKSYRPQRNDS